MGHTLLRNLHRWQPPPARRPFRFPDDYLVFDLETTGFSRKHDLIWAVGWAVVRDGAVANSEELVLDWTQETSLDQGWLHQKVAAQSAAMTARGLDSRLSIEKLRTGTCPADGLEAMFALLEDYLARGGWVAGHNHRHFDCQMIDAHLARFFGDRPMPWDKELQLDTAMFAKADLIGEDASVHPMPGQPLSDWYRRVHGYKSDGLGWSLDRDCEPRYNLTARFGLASAEGRAHNAGYDCRLTHALLETFRQIATGAA